MSKYDIQSQLECKNRILNVKIQYSARLWNVKIGFRMSKFDIQPQFECQNRILNAEYDNWPNFDVIIGF